MVEATRRRIEEFDRATAQFNKCKHPVARGKTLSRRIPEGETAAPLKSVVQNGADSKGSNSRLCLSGG